MSLLVLGVPVFFFLASPALIAESMYEARYGVVYRISAGSPVGHDLSCCWDPFLALVIENGALRRVSRSG